jgi:hypothetical protein
MILTYCAISSGSVTESHGPVQVFGSGRVDREGSIGVAGTSTLVRPPVLAC